jgi:nucleoside-diphosphate-sugar epimerase
MRVTVIGANGFVGSAFARLLKTRRGIELTPVTRETYAQFRGVESDVVIDAAGNSKKFLADQNPAAEFEASVTHRLRTLLDFPATLHLHLSSVDVYNDLSSPDTTREDTPVDLGRSSHYGAHKFLTEQLVRHYSSRWLIVRLGGMVGPGLRKNPVYDILHGEPLRIHPESQYQFLHTDDAARIAWDLAQAGAAFEAFNVCGEGLISPREISLLAGRSLNLKLVAADMQPRIVNVSVAKTGGVTSLPETRRTIEAFGFGRQAFS